MHEIFENERLCETLNMMQQLKHLDAGVDGSEIPPSLLAAFKDGATSALRRDEFIISQAIEREEQAELVEEHRAAGTAPTPASADLVLDAPPDDELLCKADQHRYRGGGWLLSVERVGVESRTDKRQNRDRAERERVRLVGNGTGEGRGNGLFR